jgi:molybdenum cofactor cytidylyltransferase
MLFAKPLFDKLVGLHGDKAAWKLVDANPELIATAELDMPFPEDVNTREDFERLSSIQCTPS